jgi:hypothetical protein
MFIQASNGGTSGETAHKGDASDFIDTADLGDYVDAIIGPVLSKDTYHKNIHLCLR